jgi:hypothetical protein
MINSCKKIKKEILNKKNMIFLKEVFSKAIYLFTMTIVRSFVLIIKLLLVKLKISFDIFKQERQKLYAVF